MNSLVVLDPRRYLWALAPIGVVVAFWLGNKRLMAESPSPQVVDVPDRVSMPRQLCIKGVDTVSRSLARQRQAKRLVDRNGRLDIAAFRELSNRTLGVRKHAERVLRRPPLEQRFGRERDNQGRWHPVRLPRVRCVDGSQGILTIPLP